MEYGQIGQRRSSGRALNTSQCQWLNPKMDVYNQQRCFATPTVDGVQFTFPIGAASYAVKKDMWPSHLVTRFRLQRCQHIFSVLVRVDHDQFNYWRHLYLFVDPVVHKART